MPDFIKNIDKLFQQKLKNHKVKAPANAWGRLQNDLHRPAKRGYFWPTRAAAAAVLLMLAFGGGYFFSDLSRHDDGKLAEVPKVEESRTIQNPDLQTAGFIEKENGKQGVIVLDKTPGNDEQAPAGQNNPAINNRSKSTSGHPVRKPDVDGKIFAKAKVEVNEANVAVDKSVVETTNTPEALPDMNIEQGEAIAENIEDDNQIKPANIQPDGILQTDGIPLMDDEMLHQLLISGDGEFAGQSIPGANKASKGNWKIGGRVSPVYSYRYIDGAALEIPDETVDAGYFNNNEGGLTTIGGGISLEYMFNERLSMASGMYISRVGQQNNEVLAYNDPESPNMYKLTTSTGTVTVNPAKFESVIVNQAVSAKGSPGDYAVNGTFIQNLDYLEVPLVLKYKVLDKKFSVNVSGGLSPGILVNNRSYFEFEGEKLQTGTTENIDPFIYNSVLGVGLEYAISRKFFISMEPSFKYSLAPVNSNNGISYHPYSVSWFTGISYKID